MPLSATKRRDGNQVLLESCSESVRQPSDYRRGQKRIIHGVKHEGSLVWHMTYSRQQRSELAGSPLTIDYDTHTLRYGRTNRGSLMAEHNYRRSQARAVCQRDLERGQLTELRQRLGEPEVRDFAGRQDDGNNVRVVTHAVECPTCHGDCISGLAVYRICPDPGSSRVRLNRV